MNWNQTHALVTGGTRGIGRALVGLLLEKGATVTATGLTSVSVDQARKECPKANWIVFDQSDENQRIKLVERMNGKGVNLLIHNAGVQQLHDFTQAGETLQHTTDIETAINFIGPVELTQLMLPQMRHVPGARLVFVTSGLALAPKRSSPVYCANKAGLRSFAKSLRAQLRNANWNIEVTEALPPLVDTDMTRGRGRGKISAQTAARQIVEGIQAGKLEIYVGASALLRVINRISPALAEAIMIKR
jgi:uncharacterized oxidoreductase